MAIGNKFLTLQTELTNTFSMKNIVIAFLSALFLLSSCGTYTGQGAHTGAGYGMILGSAIGGITGGPRGHDVGTIVGMAGGAVVGAAVGSAADKAQQRKREEMQQRREDYGNWQRNGNSEGYSFDDSGFDPNHGGDDRIDFGNEAAFQLPSIEIRNISFADENNDSALSAGERSKISFELMNRSKHPIHNITPVVTELSGNKRIIISPSVCVEKIMPGRGIRYTATVAGAKRLKNGEAAIRIGARIDTCTQGELPYETIHIKTKKN